MRIVIVDDESVICDGLLKAVSAMGNPEWVVAKVFMDSEEALELCDWDRVDLLLVDITMPGMSGLEMTEHLRERGFDTLVIVITGYPEFEYARQAIRNNVIDFIVKPVAPEKLRAAVEKAEGLFVERERLKNSQWFMASNHERLARDFFADILFETREISDEEQKRTLSLLGLTEKRFSIIEFLSQAERDSIRTAVESLKKGCNAVFHWFSIGSGLYLVLGVCGSAEEFDFSRLKRELEGTVRDIIWSDTLCFEKPEDLVRMHTQLLKQMRKTNYARGLPFLAAETGSEGLLNTEEEYSHPVKKTVQCIREQYRNPLSLGILSGQVEVHPTYLSNLFKKQTGLSLIDYINHYRIEQAKKLLRDPLSRIFWVSEQVGFANQRYFSQVFRRVTGLTPVQYRSNCLLNLGERDDPS